MCQEAHIRLAFGENIQNRLTLLLFLLYNLTEDIPGAGSLRELPSGPIAE